jgi:peptide/nickel transport system permease protein
MILYAIKRILSAIPIFFGLITVVFLITRLLPGDPALLFISPMVPPDIAEQLRREYGLDQPLLVQYAGWLAGIAEGNLGFSFTHQRAVVDVIGSALHNTAMLAGTAITIQIILGVSIGMLAARYRHTVLERAISYGGLVIYTMPAFWVATLLLIVFSGILGILPASHMHSVDAEKLNQFDYFIDGLTHLILPALTLAIPGAAGLARFVHSQVTVTMKQQYIVTAKSFGFSDRKILLKIALPNALLPVTTLIGLELGGLLSGALVTETIFAWPGIGRVAVTALFARDYPLILGCTMISGVMVIAGNLITDMLYTIADPRIKVTS